MRRIQTLNLDPNFIPLKGANKVRFSTLDFYSGMEPHIKIDTGSFNCEDDVITLITGRPKNGNDLLRIFLAANAVRSINPQSKLWLFLPFMPFARQDRVCEEGEPLSVKVFADIINSQRFDRVYIYDPHSDVAPALINNCCVIKNHWFVDQVMSKIDNASIVSPDAGSYKKIFTTARAIAYSGEIVICDKVRDTSSGKIIQTTVNSEDLNGRDIVIVDDICDGGRTFIEIAKELKKRNAGRLFLAITFGIFSNGFEDLSKYFDGIFCTNLLKDIDNPLVTVVHIALMKDDWYGLINI